MKSILLKLLFNIFGSILLWSCKEEQEQIGDYLPLKVGTKYLYSIYEGYYEPSLIRVFLNEEMNGNLLM
jgi:hypothetical protein